MEKETINNIAELLKVLGNSIRIQILLELEETDLDWSTLINKLKISSGALSFHLCRLENYQLISKENEIYMITKKGKKIIQILNDYQRGEENE